MAGATSGKKETRQHPHPGPRRDKREGEETGGGFADEAAVHLKKEKERNLLLPP